MTRLDKLALQIENILDRQKELISENDRLKKEVEMLSNADESILKLEQERALEALTKRLEKLLT